MNFKRIIMALVAAGSIAVAGSRAVAGTAYQAVSGFPFNNAALSNYTVTDGMVCFTNGRVWIVSVPVPSGIGTTTHNLTANYTSLGSALAFSFNPNGSVFAGVNFNFSFPGQAAISTPLNGTVFAKFIATNPSPAGVPTCVQQVVFVN